MKKVTPQEFAQHALETIVKKYGLEPGATIKQDGNIFRAILYPLTKRYEKTFVKVKTWSQDGTDYRLVCTVRVNTYVRINTVHK